MSKLMDLAAANIKKGDEEKAMGALKDAVEDNRIAFVNATHEAEKRVRVAKKAVESNAANPHADPMDILAAIDELAVATKEVAQLGEIASARF